AFVVCSLLLSLSLLFLNRVTVPARAGTFCPLGRELWGRVPVRAGTIVPVRAGTSRWGGNSVCAKVPLGREPAFSNCIYILCNFTTDCLVVYLAECIYREPAVVGFLNGLFVGDEIPEAPELVHNVGHGLERHLKQGGDGGPTWPGSSCR